MAETVRRTLRHLLCCLVIVSMVTAMSVAPRPARADGGGGDPQANASTVAAVVAVSIILLSLQQMPFLRGFQARPGAVQVALLMTSLTLRAAMLNMLATRRRGFLLSNVLTTTVLFVVATYAVALTAEMARRRAALHTVLFALGLSPLFNSPAMVLQRQKLLVAGGANGLNNATLTALSRRNDVMRYGDGPVDRPVYRNLFLDAATGDPTAQALVALLPRYHSNGYLPFGDIIGPVGLAAMELPGLYLTPSGPAYDPEFWSHVLSHAHHLAECGECYFEAEEDAYYGDWESELELDIADELIEIDYERRFAGQPRLLHKPVLLELFDDMNFVKRQLTSAGIFVRLPSLSNAIRAAFATNSVVATANGPTWSLPFGYADKQGESKAVSKIYARKDFELKLTGAYYDRDAAKNVALQYKAASNQIEPRPLRYGLDLKF